MAKNDYIEIMEKIIWRFRGTIIQRMTVKC